MESVYRQIENGSRNVGPRERVNAGSPKKMVTTAGTTDDDNESL